MNITEKDESDLIELQGRLEHIVFENKENGFVIAKVRVADSKDLITVTGVIAPVNPGETLNMIGKWHCHEKFGDQLKITCCTTITPKSEVGIESYLSSGLIQGIGPILAKRIVKEFGNQPLAVIELTPDKLRKIEGIGRERLKIIKKSWNEQKGTRSTIIFLQSYGLSASYASKIYKYYKNNTIEIVKKDPYKLASDIDGIGFLTADAIAQKMGFSSDSAIRASAGVLFALQELTQKGHVYYPKTQLTAFAKKLLNIDEKFISQAIEDLAQQKSIIIENLGKGAEEAVFLPKYHWAEIEIAQKLEKIKNTPKDIDEISEKMALAHIQNKLSISLAEKQTEAIQAALSNKILIITGCPGTGKTTIIKAIIELFSLVTRKILLAAPTGRAAKRMSEATHKIAKTIHRLLEFDPLKWEFQKNEEAPLKADLIILDEASMIDTLLMYDLLKAIPPTSSLIIVGDTNQLPSIGAGNVLKDIIVSKAFPVIELNEIFRQAEQSEIIVNAHKIIRGEDIHIGNQGDFIFINETNENAVLNKVVSIIKNEIPTRFNYDPVNDVQVLSPMKRGIVGCINMNKVLQEALNPQKFYITKDKRNFCIGDKVMQIKNNYTKNIFNGDIGTISYIDAKKGVIYVNIDGNNIEYEYNELDELMLAYAISIHKSQGSEYPAVVIPLVMSHAIMLQRNLIYTGITRGQKLVIVVGSEDAMRFAIRNKNILARNTWLKRRLVKE